MSEKTQAPDAARDSAALPEIEDVLALSPLQEGLFSLAELAGADDLYIMQIEVEITGPVDVALLRRSVEAIVRRHANLRAVFWDRDLPRPVQIVPRSIELPWFERAADTYEFAAIAESEARRGFDLERGPALRVVLATLPDGSRRMILTAHHILMDGWSLGVFFREVFAVYQAGGSAAALPAPRPYRDYIGWLAARDSEADLRLWADYLGDVEPLILGDRSSSIVNTIVPEVHKLTLDAVDTDRVRRWAGAHGLTMNTVVQFAWALVLGRLTDRQEVVFGTTVSGRPDELSGVETMIGLFINTIPVRIQLGAGEFDAERVAGTCAQLQREAAAMRDVGYLSLSTIQRAVGRGALFDTLFVFENAPVADVFGTIATSDGARFQMSVSQGLTHYPLAVVSYLLDGELSVGVEAVPALLGRLSVSDLVARLVSILRRLPALGDGDQGALDVLLPHERPRPPEATAQDARGATVPELFARQVAATPDALALTTEHERYTYRELSEAASRVAAVLAQRGIGAEDVVALAMPRSAQSIVAILGVLAAGAAYVPVDIDLPAARIESIVRQSKPRLVLVDGAGAAALAEVGGLPPVLAMSDAMTAKGSATASPSFEPAQCAYLIFTSGSTGEPKGVMGTHAALASYFADHRDRVYRPAVARSGRPLRIAHAWSLSFDASWQPLIGLLDGHMIHLFGAEEMRDAQRLVDGMNRHRVDMIDTTPSMFAQLAEAGLIDGRGTAGPAVLALGGEAIGVPLWKQLCALPNTAVYNCYGPTETTVEAVVASVADAAATPAIGAPTAGMTGYVLDSGLRAVPDGVVGELYLSGAQLARGYVGKSGVTAERFVADPFRSGERMYRTGDLVQRLPSGELAYLGRADGQVKIRGYRIEIGEIETALLSLPQVRAAAVIAVRRPSGPALVGFVVGADGTTARIRADLAERLPAYMVPQRILALDALPVTTNGKLDARQLEVTAREALSSAGGEAPKTETERNLCAVVAELTGGAKPGVEDDLVEFGLDSIVAISLVNALRGRGISTSPRMVLTAGTIRELAARIDSGVTPGRAATAEDYGAIGRVPILSWMHEYGGYRRLSLCTLLELPPGVDQPRLEAALQSVLDGHDLLRSRFSETATGYDLYTRAPGCVRAGDILTRVQEGADFRANLAAHARGAAAQIDPLAGDLVRAVWFTRSEAPDLLLLSIHHIAVDPVSWYIICADLAESWARLTAPDQIATAQIPALAPAGEYTGYRLWAERIRARAGAAEVAAQREYWLRQSTGPDPVLGARRPDPKTDTLSSCHVHPVLLPVETTAAILDGLAGELGVREFLLAALTMTLATWRVSRGQDPTGGAYVAMEGHGREDALLGEDIDTARTVGWFTSIFPARFGAGADYVDISAAQEDPSTARALIDAIAAQLSEIPNRGLDYGVLRYLEEVPELVGAPEPQVLFDYLGRLDLVGANKPWTPVTDTELLERLPMSPEPEFPLRHAIDVIAAVHATPAGPQLVTLLRWSDAVFTEADVHRFAEIWRAAVASLERALSPISVDRTAASDL
ncbi:non-ribosomal peptide synthetase [Nocardia asiatica]|uniref:non-ribosomal peptide synthetase n=1 Tax=Nocardia asiatica TaxID=209252 RepID=UPI0024567EDC|nr:non-ribosomal peptide synthetase [Nocardia asiatica]